MLQLFTPLFVAPSTLGAAQEIDSATNPEFISKFYIPTFHFKQMYQLCDFALLFPWLQVGPCQPEILAHADQPMLPHFAHLRRLCGRHKPDTTCKHLSSREYTSRVAHTLYCTVTAIVILTMKLLIKLP